MAFWLLGAGPHRWIRLRFQLWFVHLVPLKSKVFTLSFFWLMHSPLSNSPKREGHQGLKNKNKEFQWCFLPENILPWKIVCKNIWNFQFFRNSPPRIIKRSVVIHGRLVSYSIIDRVYSFCYWKRTVIMSPVRLIVKTHVKE